MNLTMHVLLLVGVLSSVLSVTRSSAEKTASEKSSVPSACGPAGICHCTSVKTVDCRQRGLSVLPKNIPNDTLRLDLANNKITFIPKNAMMQFTDLIYLNISRNKIEKSFSLPSTINSFFANDNKLKTISNFFSGEFLYLKDVNLENNDFADIPDGIFKGCPNLQHLNLKNNDLKYIPDGTFTRCSKLQNLKLDGNPIVKLTNETLKGLTNILQISMRYVPLEYIDADAFMDPCQSLQTFVLKSCKLETLPKGLFRGCHSLQELIFAQCDFRRFGEVEITGPQNLMALEISRSYSMPEISEKAFVSLNSINTISITMDNLSEIPAELFRNVTIGTQVNFGFNRLRHLPEDLFKTNNSIQTLMLHCNEIVYIPQKFFRHLSQLKYLFLFRNYLTRISSGMFLGTSLTELYLFRNSITEIVGQPFNTSLHSVSSIKIVELRDNPIEALSDESIDNLSNETSLVLNCEGVDLPRWINDVSIRCVSPSDLLEIQHIGRHTMRRAALSNGGFYCVNEYNTNVFTCTACSNGTYGSKIKTGCFQCPAGGFYQENVGMVSEAEGDIKCHTCDKGTYVHERGGNSSSSCNVCPEGTDKNRVAGFRACYCLKNYYRTDRFDKCMLCPQRGLLCDKDVVMIAHGYYWNWTLNDLYLYKDLVRNLQTFNDSYNRSTSTYNGSFPIVYECPKAEICINNIGNVEGNCKEGYTDWMCTVCKDGYFKLFGYCKPCTSFWLLVIDFVVFTASFLLLLFIILKPSFGRRDVDHAGRSFSDIVVSRVKIVLGFYQVVTNYWHSIGTFPWTKVFQKVISEIMKTFRFTFITLFVSPSCFMGWFKWNPHTQLKLLYAAYGVFLLVMIVSYIIAWRIMKKIERRFAGYITGTRKFKDLFLKAMVVILFITYTETCHVTFQLFFCDEYRLYEKEKKTVLLLHSDYSIHCDTATHRLHKLLSIPFIVYIIVFPITLLIALKKYSIANVTNGIHPRKYPEWLYFLCENYKAECWYWEILELSRKLLLTFIPLRFGWKGLSKIVGLTLSVLFLSIHIYKKPIKNKGENRLQLVSLLFLNFNMTVTAVSMPEDVEGFVLIFVSILNVGIIVFLTGKAVVKLYYLAKKTLKYCLPLRHHHRQEDEDTVCSEEMQPLVSSTSSGSSSTQSLSCSSPGLFRRQLSHSVSSN
ncbi:Leucine-rich repeat-containing G-protein coupled receptor 4 [Holothuria leucospilota]|uniref:Leucine-rich repeat-containing G-protein coupled receptor 4 n=1 Tax=Holothuria leucospilota TaxID=206669 RepID=A0A9Q0YD50_HOLLE|nr:Leucine-rich repeat-containing G-protein coupled receptor 4 [Holothuria leucospilota]